MSKVVLNPLSNEFDDIGFSKEQIEAIVDSRVTEVSSGVISVNGESGVVVLAASDVGAATTAQGAKADSALQADDIGSTVASFSDPRLSDARTPTDGSVTTAKIAGGGLSPSAITGTAVVTTDPRLSDARIPTTHSQSWSTIIGTPTTLSGYGITNAATSAQGAKADSALQAADIGSTVASYTDPRLSDARTPVSHSQAWSTITGTPTTLAGYGITDGASGSAEWADITGKPTTLSGYGITDAASSASLSSHTGNTSNPHSTTKAQVGLGSVLDAPQLTVANNLSDLNSAGTARTNLGLGSIATQSASNVAIAGGAFNGTVGATTPNTGGFTSLFVQAASGVETGYELRSGSSLRWQIVKSSGTDSFALNAFDDAGAYADTPIFIPRTTASSVTFNRSIVCGGVTISGTGLTATGAISAGTTITATGQVAGASLKAGNLTSGKMPLISTSGLLTDSVWSMDTFGSVTLPSSSNISLSGNNSGFLLNFKNNGTSFSRNGLSITAGNNTGGGAVFLRFLSADSSFSSDFSMASGIVSLNKAFAISDTTASTSSTTGSLTAAGGAGVAGSLYVGGSSIALNQGIKSGSNSLIQKPSGLTIATQSHYIGNTVPSSPALNDIWDEHDSTGKHLMRWQWDATYWKSAEFFTASIFMNSIGATSSGWFSAATSPVQSWSGVWVDSVDYLGCLINTPVDAATNYWTFQSLKASTNSAYTALHAAYQMPVLAAGSRFSYSIPSTDQYASFANFFQFRYAFTKVGNPGNILVSAIVVYRIVR